MAESRAPLIRRRDAAQATLDRFRAAPFQWGTRDCARLVAHHLRLMGHKVKLPPSGSYRSLLGAKKALKAAGHDTLTAAIDALGFERVPPAAAVVGDIVELPSENGLSALTVALGNGRLVGYHPDATSAVVIQPVEYLVAWKVDPA